MSDVTITSRDIIPVGEDETLAYIAEGHRGIADVWEMSRIIMREYDDDWGDGWWYQQSTEDDPESQPFTLVAVRDMWRSSTTASEDRQP